MPPPSQPPTDEEKEAGLAELTQQIRQRRKQQKFDPLHPQTVLFQTVAPNWVTAIEPCCAPSDSFFDIHLSSCFNFINCDSHLSGTRPGDWPAFSISRRWRVACTD